MSRNRLIKPLTLRRELIECGCVLAVACILPLVVMRGLDEIEARRIDGFGIPESDDVDFWRYRERAIIRSRMKERDPLFFSSRWGKIIEEIEAR